MSLRSSQIETLNWAVTLEAGYGPFEAGDLAWRLNIQTRSAARRLKALVATGHLEVHQGETSNRRFYSLTNKGKEALASSGGSE